MSKYYLQSRLKLFILEFFRGILLGLEILARGLPALFFELFVKISRRRKRTQERLAMPSCDCCHDHPLNQLYYAPGGFVFQERDNAYFIQGMMLSNVTWFDLTLADGTYLPCEVLVDQATSSYRICFADQEIEIFRPPKLSLTDFHFEGDENAFYIEGRTTSLPQKLPIIWRLDDGSLIPCKIVDEISPDDHSVCTVQVGSILKHVARAKLRRLPSPEGETLSDKLAFDFWASCNKIIQLVDNLLIIFLYKLGVILFAVDPESTGQ